jgi:hypothetical protein
MSGKKIGVWRDGLGNEATRHKVISRLQQYREFGPPALLFLASIRFAQHLKNRIIETQDPFAT